MKEFSIHFSEEQMEALRHRIGAARLPKILNGEDWRLGTGSSYLSALLDSWQNGYDWSHKEKELNRYPQYTCELNGTTIHFFHIPGSRKGAVPLLLTHGWPDSFLRYAKAFPLLAEFDLVVPSLPGFAFSTLPEKGYVNNAEIAEIWHKLMTEVLGYKEYAASGGDMGRGVTCYLASRYPNEVKGIHLTDVGMAAELVGAPDSKLNSAELDYKRKVNEWLRTEGVYISMNGTKPQTLAYSLSDSPAGMAAWITEKYRAWSDWPLLTMDDILDCLTLYWMTNTAGTAIRVYHGNNFTLPPLGKIQVPTAIAAFPKDILPVPREWIEKNYPVVMYTEMPRGGHFTALEQPEAFAENVSEFLKIIV
ncbi:epoxide hydrolase family protein [Treponema brennaborense]|uniref:Microsomal epoxide hydrolase n=1 Tax=Treponema brennaborense (strain DSM 12168 / CIP 105900 / DD5/3) TaxID=906968 RepID=F4LJZ2_TREBD|nr:epoxide hydrolase family protein [Treponema brennaborense]AEE16472.1 Microsomal epoxide hydrolase [Treponema brennaborense DSM 12168]